MVSAQNKQPKVALVMDWIYGGGAEKVLWQLHLMYPKAPIYTSYCSQEWREKLNNQVITGYLQKWPFAKARKFLPLLRQWWFRRLDLSEYDIVISLSGNGESKFIKTRDDATHVCYCHTPPHFYWRKYKDYMKNPGFGSLNFLARLGLLILVKPLRKRDYQAAQKVDYFIANSTHIQNDIKEFYGLDSIVIHPPIETDRFKDIKRSVKKPSFVIWGRHVPDKRIDIAIGACNQLKLPLTILGKGPITDSLKSIAGKTITFKGFVSDSELEKITATSSAFIFTSLEDFGIAPVEAMASGTPVIAYKAGGALDYIEPGKTGEFFDEQSADSLAKALQNFDSAKYDASYIKKSAQKFSNQNFTKKFTAFVASSPSIEK